MLLKFFNAHKFMAGREPGARIGSIAMGAAVLGSYRILEDFVEKPALGGTV
jgi:hypothetical protein